MSSQLTMLLVIISNGTLAASVMRAHSHATLLQQLRLPCRHLPDNNIHILPQAL